ncbi:hypothetical protein PFISCL1PPCAC_26758, partial [Pristionchus fissidentatus]
PSFPLRFEIAKESNRSDYKLNGVSVPSSLFKRLHALLKNSECEILNMWNLLVDNYFLFRCDEIIEKAK